MSLGTCFQVKLDKDTSNCRSMSHVFLVKVLFSGGQIKHWLVVLTILKNISQWVGLSRIITENKKCLKPPTRTEVK